MLEDAQFPQGCFYVFLQMLQVQVPSMSSEVILGSPRDEGFWVREAFLSMLGRAHSQDREGPGSGLANPYPH